MIAPKYHVFLCTSCRANGVQKGFCHSKGSVDLIGQLMEEIDENDLSSDVMVTNTGCFGICDKGPIMVVYPEGTWYGNLNEDAISRIVTEHFEGGNKVVELEI